MAHHEAPGGELFFGMLQVAAAADSTEPIPWDTADQPVPDHLRPLAAAAARQAAALLADHTPLQTDPVLDAVHRITALPPGPFPVDTAHRLHIEPATLRTLLSAHHHGGCAAAHTVLHHHPADLHTLDAATRAIAPLRPTSRLPLKAEDNRITDPAMRIELRLGPDARWHPFGQFGTSTTWESLAEPHTNPAHAYRTALAARRAHAAL